MLFIYNSYENSFSKTKDSGFHLNIFFLSNTKYNLRCDEKCQWKKSSVMHKPTAGHLLEDKLIQTVWKVSI